SFFFVRTCASSSLRPDRLICLFMSLFYHAVTFSAHSFLCGVALIKNGVPSEVIAVNLCMCDLKPEA
ncbi:hypothetical protein NE626_12540, partial [Intestinimonas massiliensis]|uniref:hypothetical protein n=1 Tax=Intestinimonas massiliensis (ex Afouda et al. 2020) TaxID=1673721 RepID=UPI0021095AED